MQDTMNRNDKWLAEQVKRLKALEATGRRLKIDFVRNARDKGKLLMEIDEYLLGKGKTLKEWVILERNDIGIGYSTALLYIDVALNFELVKERFADSNGLELTLTQVRDAIRDARQAKGKGKPGSGRKAKPKAPPSEPHTLSFPSSAVAKGEEGAQDAGPATASFAGDEPANVPEPPSDEDEAQEEEQPGLVINYDIKATVALANGINAATFEDESYCGVAHWLVKNGNGKTLATVKVTGIQRSGS